MEKMGNLFKIKSKNILKLNYLEGGERKILYVPTDKMARMENVASLADNY